jgi:LPS sulfotransferase NodH
MNGLRAHILATERSGSFFLCDILNRYDPSFDIQEHFSRVRMLRSYIDNNFTFDIKNSKIMPTHVKLLKSYQDRHTDFLLYLQERSPDFKFIYNKRRDFVAQAASLYMVRMTGDWRVYESNKEEYRNKEISYLESDIKVVIGEISEKIQIWEKAIEESGIETYEIYYEDILSNPTIVLGNLFDYLGLDRDRIDECLDGVQLLRQSDIRSDDYKRITDKIREIYGSMDYDKKKGNKQKKLKR